MMFLDVYRLGFEWNILDYLYKIQNNFFTYFFYFISEFGASIAVLIIITLYYWCINKEEGKRIAFICFFTICLNNVIKGIVSAKRPFEYTSKEYLRKLSKSKLSDSASGSSFPSGHSQNSSALYGSIFLSSKNNKILQIICIILIILVPISRMYLGVHFPGDVVVGTMLGLITALLITQIFMHYHKQSLVIFIISIILFLPFIFLPNIAKDYFKGLGLLIGLLFGNIFENKFVNFKDTNNTKVRILRYIFGAIIISCVYFLVHVINHLEFILNNHYLLFTSNFITHLFLSFLGVGIIPIIFKKISFLR